MAKVGIIGGGAWGTALATVAQRAGSDAVIWAREKEVVQGINQDHENPVFLKGIKLRPSIRATGKFSDCFDASLLLIVVPSQFVRATLGQMANEGLPRTVPLALCSKGVEQKTLQLMHEVAQEVVKNPLAVISGPTFAGEAALGLPTSVSLACEDRKLAKKTIAPCLAGEHFKIYHTKDVIGAEIAGAMKNVIAIACGMAEGKRLGQNAVAALMTRGLKEMRKLCVELGGKPRTLMELCGVGDLILTCSSQTSRNMSLGYLLGQGKTLAEIMESRMSVAEGVASSNSVTALAKRHEISLPICQAVYDILHGKKDVDATIERLIQKS